MAPIWEFRDTADVAGDTFTDITDYFRLYDWEVTSNAEEGSVGSSQVTADDPLGTFSIRGHRQFRIREDTASGSNTVIYAGYTADRIVKRGDYHRVETARVWDINLTDINTILGRRIFDRDNANRPAETDVARIQWLLAREESQLIDDARYFNTTGGVAMSASDYRGQTVEDVLNDCAQQSGKNYFVWFAEDISEFSLFYDFDTSESYSSPLRLSNFLDDIDGVWTFAISDDTELRRDPSRTYSGVYLNWDGGTTYAQNDTTVNLFARRDVSMSGGNVKSAAAATSRVTRYLTDLDEEEDFITTTVILPASKVNFLMQGMRVQFRASHLPPYSEFTWLRAINRTVRHLSEDFYAVTVELTIGESPVVPTPEGEEAFGVLYQPQNGHTGDYNRSDDIVWGSTGDLPASGYPYAPLQGGLSYISSTYTVGDRYDGFLVSGTGTLDFEGQITTAEVYGAGTWQVVFEVLKNGSVVASVSEEATFGGLGYWSPTLVLTGSTSVVPGDIISTHLGGDLSASGRFPVVPAGSGTVANKLVVSGTLA